MILATPSILRLARLALLGLTVATVATAAAAHATTSVPSPDNSSVPACMTTSPDASRATTIVVRDLANVPVANSFVRIEYAECTSFDPCPQTGDPPDDYVVDLPSQTIRTVTNLQGQAILHVRAGGGCSASNLRLYADGVFLGAMRSGSTDQDADHAVDGADLALLQSKMNTTDFTGDLNCDFMVNEDDETILVGSLGAECVDPTPTRPSTWGRVKILYR